MDPNDLEKFKTFIETCQNTPEILWIPELKFFRDFIHSLGGTIPEANKNTTKPNETTSEDNESEKMDESAPPAEESEESDVELDSEGVIEPETQTFPEMGDGSKLVTEEEEIAAGEKRSEAMAAMSDGDLDKAISLFTEAIKLNPTSAMMYAKRANILLKQKRVKAAIRDCDEAVRLNPDSATAHKFRGRAHRLLGEWLEAVKDLRLACKLDFDEQSHEWLKEVEPNASKLEEHNRKYERKQQEKLQKEKVERIRKAREEHKKAAEEQQNSMPGGFPGMAGGFPGMAGGFPGMAGGFPGMAGGFPGGKAGGFPGKGGGDFGGLFDKFSGAGGASDMPEKDSGDMPNIEEVLKDPDFLTAMQDPEVAAAFRDVSTNPNNIYKYKDNAKVSKVISSFMTKFGGEKASSMPDFQSEGAGSTGSCPAGFGNASDSKSSDDLD